MTAHIELMLILWLASWVTFMLMIIACSLARCRKCGGWHASKEEEDNCHEN